MKAKFAHLILVLFVILSSGYAMQAAAQTIKFVPSPLGNKSYYLGNAAAEQFAASTVISNGNLYSPWFNSATNQYQLGQFNGDSVSLIPNPINPGKYGGVFAPFTVYNNSLLASFAIRSGKDSGVELAQYNGSSFTLTKEPTNIQPFFFSGFPVQANGKLYSSSVVNRPDSSHYTQFEMEVFDGKKITVIPNPQSIVQDSVNYDYAAVSPCTYNNNIYANYFLSNLLPYRTSYRLAKLNSTKYTFIPNPDAGIGFVLGSLVYKNLAYGGYSNASGHGQLASFDGTTISLIPNPDNIGNASGGIIIYKNKLYFIYAYASRAWQLASYDGTTTTLINNPTGSKDSTIGGAPFIIYNNKLYFQYILKGGTYELAQYDGTNIKLIANPDNGPGYAGYFDNLTGLSPIVWGNKLYIDYKNVQHHRQLAVYDGSSLTLIPNPDFIKSDTMNGYSGEPVIFKNNLYFGYISTKGLELAYLDTTSGLAKAAPPSAAIQKNNSIITIAPNPAHTSINVGFVSSGAGGTVQIFNVAGQLMLEKQIDPFNGKNTVQFDISKLAAGTYMLLIKTKEGTQTKEFVKE